MQNVSSDRPILLNYHPTVNTGNSESLSVCVNHLHDLIHGRWDRRFVGRLFTIYLWRENFLCSVGYKRNQNTDNPSAGGVVLGLGITLIVRPTNYSITNVGLHDRGIYRTRFRWNSVRHNCSLIGLLGKLAAKGGTALAQHRPAH